MSGLYNLVMGDGNEMQRGQALIAVLASVQPVDVGRYRDSWVEKHDGEPIICIYTRNGGGNRECYCDSGCTTDTVGVQPDGSIGVIPGPPCTGCTGCIGVAMTKHPLYLRDADDDFDSTYATFYFKAPDDQETRTALLGIAQDEPVDMSENWKQVIAALGKEGKPADG